MVDLRPTVSLAGSSGVSYTYWIFPIDWVGSKEPGNYALAKLSEPSRLGDNLCWRDRKLQR